MEKKIDVDSFVLKETDIKQIPIKLDFLRKGFASHKTKSLDFRYEQLMILRNAIDKYAKEISRTNYLDLGFGEYANDIHVVAIVLSDIDYIIANFKSWAKQKNVDTPVLLGNASSYLLPEPFGVCVIFSAWNSQYQTLLQPLAAAIAAGNCVLAKPSEMAPFSAKLMEYILEDLDPYVVQIVQGGADQCIELNKNKSDIICFTGSPMKGKLIAKAAAEFLTPCILELGGQNPVIVDETANLESTATNLIGGRYVITGQACIAPEYVFVHKSIFEKLRTMLGETVNKFYGSNPKENKDYSRIINEWHTNRLSELLKTHNGKVVVGGGECDIKQRYVPPTVISFDSISEMAKSSLAKEEIFGPILYLCPYEDLETCIEYINARDKPLALYYFGFNSKNKNEIRSKTSSGAFVCNDTLVQFFNHHLPFGGVGTSGYSAYHGKSGFDNMSHLKPCVESSGLLLPVRYPPFTSFKLGFIKKTSSISQISISSIYKSLFFAICLALVYVYRNNFIGAFKGFLNPHF